jgi:hypothetical protein
MGGSDEAFPFLNTSYDYNKIDQSVDLSILRPYHGDRFFLLFFCTSDQTDSHYDHYSGKEMEKL